MVKNNNSIYNVYQQSEQSPLTSNHWTPKHVVGIQVLAQDLPKNVVGLNGYR